MIYFLQPTDGGPVKIGHSADVPARIRQLESHYGKPLALLATLPGDFAEEQAIHARFAHLRLMGLAGGASSPSNSARPPTSWPSLNDLYWSGRIRIPLNYCYRSDA